MNVQDQTVFLHLLESMRRRIKHYQRKFDNPESDYYGAYAKGYLTCMKSLEVELLKLVKYQMITNNEEGKSVDIKRESGSITFIVMDRRVGDCKVTDHKGGVHM